MRALWLVLLLSLCAGCLPRIPRQRLAERAKVAVAYIVDPTYAGKPFTPPEALKKAIAAELDDHNLELVELPLEALGNQRLSDARFEALKKSAGTPFVLLVEQRVQFFSQLDGRYRWEVGTTLTASRTGGAVARDPFEIPVILMYDHEKENEAIASAASDIATRLGVLLDGVLAGEVPAAPEPKTAAPPRPAGIYFVMVDRFADGDRSNDGNAAPEDSQAFHGGDLQGVIDHLDWIQALGFDTVWLSPIFKMRTEKWHGYGAFHGYWRRAAAGPPARRARPPPHEAGARPGAQPRGARRAAAPVEARLVSQAGRGDGLERRDPAGDERRARAARSRDRAGRSVPVPARRCPEVASASLVLTGSDSTRSSTCRWTSGRSSTARST
jgi:hypothetical protein